jgi:large subunit ribosomal protein L30
MAEHQMAKEEAAKQPADKSDGTFRIKWVRSFIGCTRDMRQTIRGLGFRRMQQVVECADTPSVRGMVHKVRHLVVVVE